MAEEPEERETTEKEESAEPAPEERPREGVDWSALFEAMSDRVEEEMVVDILAVRARLLARPEEEVGVDAGDVYTLFRLGEERYALSAAVVGEVLEAPRVTPVPQSPPTIVGLFHRRGGVYLALSTKRLLGLADNGTYRDALVLTGEKSRVALMVDAVEATRPIPASEVRPGDVGGRAVAGVTADKYIVLEAEGLWAEVRRAFGGAESGD
ncbi:MAG: chemotaxis protein CheW [Candidatus Coatesbacteria bacterium]|nr:MAG: chemotaxis protein CheW [Candidatus Coatesbacteria bacterium]